VATIINTLEVIVEPSRQPPAGQAPAPRITPAPNDIADVLERQARHAARLLAH
jgi:hypothetical protein